MEFFIDNGEKLNTLWKVFYLALFDLVLYIYSEIFNLVNLINLASVEGISKMPAKKSID